MFPRITSVTVLERFTVGLTFADGSAGIADLGPLISGRAGVFSPLHDPAYFARVSVDPEAGTLVWPNGTDLDPDMLYEAAHATHVGGRRNFDQG